MEKRNKKLRLTQMASKIQSFKQLEKVMVPTKGWVNAIRTTLGMSMRQMGQRIDKTATSIQKLERNEASDKVTLKSLKDAARALDMKLVYGLVPIHGSLEDIVEKQARKLAREIVQRTNTTMTLEDQQVSGHRLKKEEDELTKELVDEMPRNLWD